jgi:hypothetical protein
MRLQPSLVFFLCGGVRMRVVTITPELKPETEAKAIQQAAQDDNFFR